LILSGEKASGLKLKGMGQPWSYISSRADRQNMDRQDINWENWEREAKNGDWETTASGLGCYILSFEEDRSPWN
jgi:hypothetical protein